MRKDYMPVSPAQAGADEASFLRDYWGTKWRDLAIESESQHSIADLALFRLVRPYLDRLAPGSRVLDGGCGTGAWALFLSSRGLDVTGLDISDRTIDRLREVVPHQKWSVGDVRRVEFPDKSFDAYYSWGTFEHFEIGMGECLDEARRILRPNGLLCITVPFDNLRHAIRASGPLRWVDPTFDPQLGFREPHRFYQWRFTRSELMRELELHGLRVEMIRPTDKVEGIVRMLDHDLKIRPGTLPSRLMWRLLGRLLPERYVAHMLLAVAYRRDHG